MRYRSSQPYTPYNAHMSPDNTHKLMGIYMEGLVLDVNTMYMLFRFFKLFPIGCIELRVYLSAMPIPTVGCWGPFGLSPGEHGGPVSGSGHCLCLLVDHHPCRAWHHARHHHRQRTSRPGCHTLHRQQSGGTRRGN